MKNEDSPQQTQLCTYLLTQKSELNLNDEDVFPQDCRMQIASHVVFYCVKRSLQRLGLIKLFAHHIGHTQSHTSNRFLKLVEALLQIHSCFSHRIKLRGLAAISRHCFAELPAKMSALHCCQLLQRIYQI